MLDPCTLPGGEGAAAKGRISAGLWGLPSKDPFPPGREMGNGNQNDAGFPPPRE